MVNEDPDELGYSLSREGARDDLEAVMNDLPGLMWEEQKAIGRAAQFAAHADFLESTGDYVGAARVRTTAEDFRNAVGYSEDIDPNDP